MRPASFLDKNSEIFYPASTTAQNEKAISKTISFTSETETAQIEKYAPFTTWSDVKKQLHPYYGVVSGVYYAMTGQPWLSSDARKAVKTEWFWQPIRGQPRRVDTNELRKYANTVWVQAIVMNVIKQVINVPWEIVPKDEETPYEQVQEEVDMVTDFLNHPNKNHESWEEIVAAWIKDVLEIDAGVLVKVFSVDSYDFEHLEPRSGAPLLKPLSCPECNGKGIAQRSAVQDKIQRTISAIGLMEKNFNPEEGFKQFNEKGEEEVVSFKKAVPDYSSAEQRVEKALTEVSANSPNDTNAVEMQCPFCHGNGTGRRLQEIYCHDGAAFLKDSDRTGWTYGFWQYCMTKGNFVETINGVKDISEITEKDSVLGHDGKWHKVIETYSRIYDGEFVKIKAQGMPETKCTKEHPFLVQRNGKEEWVEAGSIQSTDLLVAVSESKKEEKTVLSFFEPDSYEAKQKKKYEKAMELRNLIGKGCKSLQKEIGACSATINNWLQGNSSPKCSVIPWTLELDGELSELFGWYVAEGCVTRGNIVNFTLSFNEGEHAERIQHLMQKYFGLRCSSLRQENVIQLRFFNKVLAEWFLKTFYKGEKKNARTKSIPEFLMHSREEFQKSFLNSYITGDGNYTAAGAGMSTASRTLAFDLRRMLIRLNAYPTLSYSPPRTHEFKGRIISSNGFWMLQLNTIAMRNIVLGQSENQNAKQKTVQLEFGKFLVPIQKIEKESKIERVYNFHVSEVNDYTANGFITHNSYAIPAHPMWFQPSEIVYYMQNPRGMSVYGYSPMQSSLEAVKTLEYAIKHNTALFLDGAVPDGAVSVEDMDTDEMKRMRIQWENELKGQPHKILFINKKTTFQPFAVNNKDMQYLEGIRETWKQVMANFGVSAEDLGFFEDSNRSTSGTAVETGRRKAIRPILAKIVSLVNEHILPELGAFETKYTYVQDDPVEERMKAELHEIYIRSRERSINELRIEDGLPPVPWGDGEQNMMPQFGNGAQPFQEQGQKPKELNSIQGAEEDATDSPNDAAEKALIPLGNKEPPKGASIVEGPRGGRYYEPGQRDSPKAEESSQQEPKQESLERPSEGITEEMRQRRESFQEGERKLGHMHYFNNAKQHVKEKSSELWTEHVAKWHDETPKEVPAIVFGRHITENKLLNPTIEHLKKMGYQLFFVPEEFHRLGGGMDEKEDRKRYNDYLSSLFEGRNVVDLHSSEGFGSGTIASFRQSKNVVSLEVQPGKMNEEQSIRINYFLDQLKKDRIKCFKKDYQYPFQSQVPFVTTIQNLSTPRPYALPPAGHVNNRYPYSELSARCPGCGSQALTLLGEEPGKLSVGRMHRCLQCDREFSEQELKTGQTEQERLHGSGERTDPFSGAKTVDTELNDIMSPTAPIPNLVPEQTKKGAFGKIEDPYIDAWVGFSTAPLYSFVEKFLLSHDFGDIEATLKQRKRLSEIFIEAFFSGMNLKQLSGEIEAAGFEKQRADSIARTETIRIANEAKLLQAEEKEYKKVAFVATVDYAACEKCKKLNGSQMTVKSAKGLIPVHPNCRCTFTVVPGGIGKAIKSAAFQKSAIKVEDFMDFVRIVEKNEQGYKFNQIMRFYSENEENFVFTYSDGKSLYECIVPKESIVPTIAFSLEDFKDRYVRTAIRGERSGKLKIEVD